MESIWTSELEDKGGVAWYEGKGEEEEAAATASSELRWACITCSFHSR